ncbi:MAG: hypothetical protein BGO98_44825 [Myxococcales bacterium 68-20]|nr:hypothetical protein [Myxococcales bacterium]OJY27037.1 MAG: hypothetical protein BGO98_44825 [Myxococcales bacterium 68-20]
MILGASATGPRETPRRHARWRSWGTSALAMLVVLTLVGCAPSKKKVRSIDDEDDNSKAFAELEKNGRDDTPSQPDSPAGSDKPKGPVYPAPFTAEQIRGATKNGRTYRYKVEVPNKPTKEYAITFRKVDEGGAEVWSGSDSSKRMGWLTLQQQSEFPKDKVTTRDDKLKTPAGKFECVVYEVDGDEGEVWTYYFAKKLPGAPVFFYVERNGKRLRTTTLVEHVPGR